MASEKLWRNMDRIRDTRSVFASFWMLRVRGSSWFLTISNQKNKWKNKKKNKKKKKKWKIDGKRKVLARYRTATWYILTFTFVLDGYSPRLIPFSDPKYVHPLPRPAEHLSKEKSEEIDGERKALAKPCHTTRYTLTFSSFLDTQSPRLTQFFDQKKETKVYLSLGQGGKVKKWMASEKRQRNIAALRDTSSLLAPFWILEVRGWPNSLTEKKTKQKYLSLGQGGKVKK